MGRTDSKTHLGIVVAQNAPSIPLPTDWPKHVKEGIGHVIALAQVTLTAARARSATKRDIIARLRAELAEAQREICLLAEELRLKNLRLGRVTPRGRPHYRGTERMAILELRAARRWSKSQTAGRLLLASATIAGWMKRIDEDGEDALVKTTSPVNRFPDFVRYIVQRLKEDAGRRPEPANSAVRKEPVGKGEGRPVQTKAPNHIWQVDLTLVPTAAGFWIPWLPIVELRRTA